MADTKLSALTEVTELSAADELYVNDSGVGKRITAANAGTSLLVNAGVTATTEELNILDGVTATAAELNILDGATVTVTEINHVAGVTSAIQDQIDTKAALATEYQLALGGNFAAGEKVAVSRIGNLVTVTSYGSLSLTSTTSFGFSTGALEVSERPSSAIRAVTDGNGTGVYTITISSDGTLRADWYIDTGSGSTNLHPSFSISYLVTGNIT